MAESVSRKVSANLFLRAAALGIILFLASPAGPARAASGGPDNYGYTWRDGAETGVSFIWEDISTTGTDITVRADDANTGFLPFSFAFPYYGGSYSKVAVCNNGWVSLMDNSSTTWGNGALPATSAPQGTIAAFWDDLDTRTRGRMLFRDFGDRAVITWEGVPYQSDPSALNTFQVVLHADGRIVVQYQDIQGTSDSATLGIESPDDTDGLTVLNNEPGGVPTPGYVVEFAPPPPIPNNLDCASAPVLSCGDRIQGDLALGTANQDAYRCGGLQDFSGREQVYVFNTAIPTNLHLDLTALSGSPRMIVLGACDPERCVAGPSDLITLEGIQGTYYIVVDAAPGNEGQYDLAVDCLADDLPFCGEATLQTDPWGDANGSWLVYGWLYHPFDSHNHALRVDGGAATYTQDTSCTQFPSVAAGVRMPAGPAFVTWEAPEGRLGLTLSETTSGGCCGLLVQIKVTNTDTTPHWYEYRVYHDTAFGNGNGTCTTGTVDGGPIEVQGTTYYDEVELLPLGANTCDGQVKMFSAEEPGVIRSSYEMLPPNLPTDMEFLRWNNGGTPCATWKDMVDGERIGDCLDDNSLLFIWRFPPGSGTLAPGGSSDAAYRIGWRCAFPCSGCQDPAMGTASASDEDPCDTSIVLSWAAAVFPGAGNGVYHVYRSEISFADALAQPPISPPGGLTGTSWTDTGTVPGVPLYYVVEAESTDFPGCGSGPLVGGSTDTASVGPVTDVVDTTAPTGTVGNTLKASSHSDVTVKFEWPGAPSPGADEHYVILRSDDRPDGGYADAGTSGLQSWTDPDAPPGAAGHVWFYDVRVADECENRSAD